MNLNVINAQSCCGGEPVKKNSGKQLPVVIIGGGPVGLAAAAQLSLKSEPFILFEAGESVGANILKWGHVRLFSPWQYNVDKAAKQLLEKNGWKAPNDDDIPTGQELVENYLTPLASLPELKDNIYYNARVNAVSRKGLSKIKTAHRDELPFSIYVEIDGERKQFEARAVIDASGTWDNPNPSHSDGVWTKEERSLSKHFFYGIPDILGSQKQRYLGKSVAVVGGGHSAINALLELESLKMENPDTKIYWILRKKSVKEVYGGQEDDNLPARGELGIRIEKMVNGRLLEVVTPFYIQNFEYKNERINIIGDYNGNPATISGIDEIISNTGTRPDFSFLREIRIDVDPAIESVSALAPLIDPNIHSCGTVRPHGEKELRQPEKDFYIAGVKSYGRAPTFLMATGYEQVRSIVAGLAGDWEAANKVELELPETGVCSTGLTGCCEETTVPESDNTCSDSSCSTNEAPKKASASCCG